MLPLAEWSDVENERLAELNMNLRRCVRKDWPTKEDSVPHPSVVGTALPEFTIGRVGKSSGAVGLVA